MISRASSYAIDEIRNVTIINPEASLMDLETAIDRANTGETVILDRPTDAQLNRVSELTESEIMTKDADEVYQIVRTKRRDIIDGISNWDTCGIETYCYSPADRTTNSIVAKKILVASKDIQPIFTTPTESCGKELFVYGGSTELLRSHTVSTYFASTRTADVVVGKVRCGSGSIIISLFDPTESRPRYSRFMNQIALNLGMLPEATCIDSDVVEEAVHESEGYPESVHLYADVLDKKTILDMRERTVSGYERMASTAMLSLPGWKPVTSPNGELDITHRRFALYYTIYSAVPRKNVETNLAIPNPEALTNLEIERVPGNLSNDEGNNAYHGEAPDEIELTVNGNTRTVELSDTVATVADITLERGYNYVLLLYRGKQGTLAQRWRTTMRTPETSFRFG